MLKFLLGLIKIILLLSIVLVLASAVAYIYFKATIFEEARVRISQELSQRTARDVNIGSIDVIPFQTVSIKDISVLSPGSANEKTASLKALNITFDIFAFIKNKQLPMTVSIKSLDIKGLSANVLLKIETKSAPSYKDIISPDIIDSITVIEGDAAYKGSVFSNMNGTIGFDDLVVTGGKLGFKRNGEDYFLSFDKLKGDFHGYDISMNSREADLKGAVIQQDDDLILKDLTGRFLTIDFDIDTRIADLFAVPEKASGVTPPETQKTKEGLPKEGPPKISLKTVEKETEEAVPLFVKYSDFIKDHGITAKVKVDMTVREQEPSSTKPDISADIILEELTFDDLRMESFSTSLSLMNGSLVLKDTSAVLYDATASGDMTIKLPEGGPPHISVLDITVKDMDIESITKAFGDE